MFGWLRGLATGFHFLDALKTSRGSRLQADLICLQEVDNFGELKAALEGAGGLVRDGPINPSPCSLCCFFGLCRFPGDRIFPSRS